MQVHMVQESFTPSGQEVDQAYFTTPGAHTGHMPMTYTMYKTPLLSHLSQRNDDGHCVVHNCIVISRLCPRKNYNTVYVA